MVGDNSQDGSIGCMVGLTIMMFLFAIMFPVMVFMYVDMQTLRIENEKINSRIGKYRALVERCNRE